MSQTAVLGGTALYVFLFALFAFLAIVAAAAAKTLLYGLDPNCVLRSRRAAVDLIEIFGQHS